MTSKLLQRSAGPFLVHRILLKTCAGKEVVAVFVDRNGHDPVSEIEGLLNAISMVNVNVQVQHAWVIPAADPPIHSLVHSL